MVIGHFSYLLAESILSSFDKEISQLHILDSDVLKICYRKRQEVLPTSSRHNFMVVVFYV